MRARILLVVMTGLWASVAAQAEPAKAPTNKAEQPAEKAQPVIVAAALSKAPLEVAKAQEEGPSAAAKPRRGRVTSCRCGDQTPTDN